jgi:arylsulfatase A-like enzyme
MRASRKLWLGLLAGIAAVTVTSIPASAQQPQKPNILFIMGDDIGWMQPRIYHRGLMVGETPNIDRIGNEGAIFMDYLAMQSCTSGRNAFFTGMYPLRTGMIPPQLPGSPSYLQPGTPSVAKFLLDLGYNTGEFGKNHLGDHPAALPTAHGSRNSGAIFITSMRWSRSAFKTSTVRRSCRVSRRRVRPYRSAASRTSPGQWTLRQRPA